MSTRRGGIAHAGRCQAYTDHAANLALALSQTANLNRPPRIGLLDLDIFGPSVPKLFGLEDAGDVGLTDGSLPLLPASNQPMLLTLSVPLQATP